MIIYGILNKKPWFLKGEKYMIAIIDYDAGNIRSVEKALLALGQDVTVTADRDEILHADKVILPGVGAFGDAMEKLKQSGLDLSLIHI